MTLAALADLADVIGAFGVIAGLIFVGLQLRQNTQQLRRVEINAMNAEVSPLRQSVMNNAELAEIVAACVANSRAFSATELQRLDSVFWEMSFIAFQMWDRAQTTYFPAADFERTIPSLGPVLTSPVGRTWWQNARTFFRPAFVDALEALMPGLMAPAP